MSLSLVTAPALEPVSIAEVKRQIRIGDTAGEPAPTAPTVALITPAAAGNCDNGAHRVGVTFVTADGETELGALSDVVTVADKAVNGKIAVSAIPVGGSAVTARKVYLTPIGSSTAKLAATIADNSTTTATLNVADASLGADAPSVNTTEDPQLTLYIKAFRERGESLTNRAWITQTWDDIRPCFPAGRVIELAKPPLQSVTHVKYRDTTGTLQTWATSNYVVEAPAGPNCRRGRITLAYGVTWPSTYGEADDVQIRFVAGYGSAASDVPAILKQAMLLEIATAYRHRESIVTGASVADLPGGVNQIYRRYFSHPTQRRAA